MIKLSHTHVYNDSLLPDEIEMNESVKYLTFLLMSQETCHLDNHVMDM